MNYICPKTEICAHKFCPHSQEHEHKAYTCAGNACGCPGCIPVSGDHRRTVYPLAVLLLILLGVGLVAHLQKPVLQNAIVPCDSVALADSIDQQEITSIIKILGGEKQPNGLQQAWPTAALDMQEIGRQYHINPVVLAVLCRAEGGLRNPTALKKRNAFGISRDGKMLDLPSFRYGCDRAAKIVALAMPDADPDDGSTYLISKDTIDPVHPDSVKYDYWYMLADTYCPHSAELWAANCRQIWAER